MELNSEKFNTDKAEIRLLTKKGLIFVAIFCTREFNFSFSRRCNGEGVAGGERGETSLASSAAFIGWTSGDAWRGACVVGSVAELTTLDSFNGRDLSSYSRRP